jgi:protein-tyrosine phosphatase
MTIIEDAEATPALPRLAVNGTVNFRAVWARAGDGAALRPGILFRSDALHELGPDGRAALEALGVVRVIDLRSDDEVEHSPDDLDGLGIEVDRVALMAGSVRDSMAQMAGAAGHAFGLVDVYVALLQDGDALGRAVRLVAEGGPAVVHCTAGKDRTGLVVALTLLAVGVDLDPVLEDYSRTAANLEGVWVDAMTARMAAYGLPLDGVLREIVAGSPAEAMRDALEQVVLVEGDATGYLDAIGVDAGVRQRLRAVLLEG